MKCREGCGACCIAPSLTSPIPGMPNGKPKNTPCIQLTEDLRCQIFGEPSRPKCCPGLQPNPEMCGETREQALNYLTWLEEVTGVG